MAGVAVVFSIASTCANLASLDGTSTGVHVGFAGDCRGRLLVTLAWTSLSEITRGIENTSNSHPFYFYRKQQCSLTQLVWLKPRLIFSKSSPPVVARAKEKQNVRAVGDSLAVLLVQIIHQLNPSVSILTSIDQDPGMTRGYVTPSCPRKTSEVPRRTSYRFSERRHTLPRQ